MEIFTSLFPTDMVEKAVCGHILKEYKGNGDIYILIPYKYGKRKAVCGHIVKEYRENGDIYILIQSRQ